MKRKRIHIVLPLIVLTGLSISLSRGNISSGIQGFDPDEKIPLEKIRQDIKIFRASLEEGHAALYRYSTKEEMDALFKRAEARLVSPMDEIGFLRIIAPIVASINCGHTRWRPSAAFASYLSRNPTFPPFNLKYYRGKAYMMRNYSDKTDIPIGGEVISINGHTAAAIFSTFAPVVSSDARIEPSKLLIFESTHQFGWHYTLFYGITESYTIDYLNPETEKRETFTVKGIPVAEINRRFRERYPELAKTLPPISFAYRDEIPVLTIRTFNAMAYRGPKISFPSFIKETFQKLVDEKAGHLIIDLRDNGGGSDAFGRILFAHLIDEPFKYYAALETKKREFDFLKYTNVKPERARRPEAALKKNARGWYDVLAHPNVGTMKAIKPLFRGKVYVLINRGSFSASGETTSLMHYHKKATFIGEECGAGYYGNTSGFMPLLTLPNSGIRVSVPLVRYSMAVKNYPTDRGIIPEYPVEASPEDILNHRDTVMEFALNLVKKEKR